MAKLVLFGAGDIARLADYYFTKDSEHEVVGFAVDKQYRNADQFLGRPLVDFENVVTAFPPDDFKMFVAMSYAEMNAVRERLYVRAKSLGYELVSYVSSHCTNLTNNAIGDNCFILENNTIQPFANVGNNVVLWSGNHVGHDSEIQDHCFITSHVVISGRVVVEPNCFIGVNATLRNSITIGAKSLIGAGAIIMKNTEPGSVYVPERAKRLSQTSDKIKL